MSPDEIEAAYAPVLERLTREFLHPALRDLGVTEPERYVLAFEPHEEPKVAEDEEHRCPGCGSVKWVSVSLDGGWSRTAQCVPCGRLHAPLGPGWRAGG